jgi:hypothetical protein
MNSLDWFAQIVLAGIFLFAGVGKILIFQGNTRAGLTGLSRRTLGLTRGTVYAIALVEISGALVLLQPLHFWRSLDIQLVAATGLALLALGASIYHLRRKEFAEPVIALFLLALLVMVGHA